MIPISSSVRSEISDTARKVKMRLLTGKGCGFWSSERPSAYLKTNWSPLRRMVPIWVAAPERGSLNGFVTAKIFTNLLLVLITRIRSFITLFQLSGWVSECSRKRPAVTRDCWVNYAAAG
ncbi:MAG: hypothetical protein ACREJM_11300, partial [Candidatus Saccharimonadales bacterium]